MTTILIGNKALLVLCFSVILNLAFLALFLRDGQFEFTRINTNLTSSPTSFVTLNVKNPFGVAKRCKEVVHFVFVKVHKTGSDTLGVVFQRFGHERNLSFVLPSRHKWNLRWPYNLRQKDYLPLKTNEFNILTHHCMYNRTLIRQLMPKQTKYIAILRYPYTHFKSAFNFFKIAGQMTKKNISQLHHMENFGLFLSNPDFYEKQLKVHAIEEVPSLAFDLGFQPEDQNEMQKTFLFIKQIEQDFDLIMITEYFDESLVLLRRQFCWPLRSILYITKNVKKYRTFPAESNSSYDYDEFYQKLHRKWNQVDYILYDYFNETFWRKIGEHGDIAKEVLFFKELNANVTAYCMTPLDKREKTYNVKACEWTRTFTVGLDMCERMTTSMNAYIKILKDAYHTI